MNDTSRPYILHMKLVLSYAAMSSNNHPSAPLQSLKPPSTDAKASNCATTLAWLKSNLATVYAVGRVAAASQVKPPTLSRSAYLDIYSTTHTFCMDAKQTPKRPSKDALDGGDLYRGFREEIMAHILGVRALLMAPNNNDGVDGAHDLIANYMAHWQMLTHIASLVSNLLQPLERDWISRSISESRKGIVLIKDLHTQTWKEELLQAGVNSAEATVGSMLKKAVETLEAQGEERSDRDRDLVRYVESVTSVRVAPGKKR